MSEIMLPERADEATEARLTALDRAINFHYGRDATPDEAVETARRFEAYLRPAP